MIRDQFGINTDVKFEIFQSPQEAPTFREPEFKAAHIEKINIVRKGMDSGRSTVDIVWMDANGQSYTTLITGRLIRAIAQAIGDEG